MTTTIHSSFLPHLDPEESLAFYTFGFNDNAALDDGPLWPTSFAIDKLTKAVEKQIADLVTKAVG